MEYIIYECSNHIQHEGKAQGLHYTPDFPAWSVLTVCILEASKHTTGQYHDISQATIHIYTLAML